MDVEKTVKKMKKIFEDDYIVAIDKPHGLIVNRSNTAKEGTLQDYLEEEYRFSESNPTSEFSDRSGILHRLDKDTSGVLLVAKDIDTYEKIKEQFIDRSIEKEYIAVVLGSVSDDKMEIDAPIARNPKNKVRYAVVKGGKPAVTEISKIKEINTDNGEYTLVSVFPKTGRTHQIRVHLSSVNHPVASDPIYLTKNQYTTSHRIFSRLMLHAHKISLIHPHTDEKVTFESELPQEFSV